VLDFKHKTANFNQKLNFSDPLTNQNFSGTLLFVVKRSITTTQSSVPLLKNLILRIFADLNFNKQTQLTDLQTTQSRLQL